MDTPRVTEAQYRTAVQHLLEFDVVLTMEGMGQAQLQPLCDADSRWCSFVVQQEPRVTTASGVLKWLKSHPRSLLADRLMDITAFDRRLYSVAQARHNGTASLTAEQFF